MRRTVPHIYVAGPYTNPDPVDNTRIAIEVGWMVHDAGAFPHVPHLSMLQHFQRSMPLEFWHEYDIELMRICDGVIRVPGASTGADKEIAIAGELGIPTYHLTGDADEHWPRQTEDFVRHLAGA